MLLSMNDWRVLTGYIKHVDEQKNECSAGNQAPQIIIQFQIGMGLALF